MTQSIAELETELGALETKLYPLYSAQEAANVDAQNAAAAQASASGAALTDAVLARQNADAEVQRYTTAIIPLKQRADHLRREIAARKRAEQVAKLRALATEDAEPAARAMTVQLEALLASVAAYRGAHDTMLAVGNPEDAHGIRIATDLGGVSDFIWRALAEAGLPVRLPAGPGVAPTETAANIVALAGSLR